MTLNSDNCFHKRGGLPVIKQLPIPEPYSMIHVISMDLAPGTVCTFTARMLDRFQNLQDTNTISCTVGGTCMCVLYETRTISSSHSHTAQTAPTVLPAECTFANEQCQCSCSPGFEGIANNSIDGNTCELLYN